MAWRRLGDMPLSEPMMVWLPTHICVAQPQWVKDGVVSNLTWGSIHLWRHYCVKASWAIHRGMWDFLDHQAPSLYLNQCWLLINEVLRHSPAGTKSQKIPKLSITKMCLKTNTWFFQIAVISPKGQWHDISPFHWNKPGCWPSPQRQRQTFYVISIIPTDDQNLRQWRHSTCIFFIWNALFMHRIC